MWAGLFGVGPGRLIVIGLLVLLENVLGRLVLGYLLNSLIVRIFVKEV